MGRTYVVFVGHEPGLYDTWAEASDQVIGYNYVVHDSFESREEAEKVYHAYMVRKSASTIFRNTRNQSSHANPSTRTGAPFRTTGNQSSHAIPSSRTGAPFTGNQSSHAIPISRIGGPFRTTVNQSSHASSSSGTQASFRTTGNQSSHSTFTARTEVNMTKLEEIQQNLDEIKRIVAMVEVNLEALRISKDN
ncbi:uncharacterized protein [Henckelia pumila]|uniref:uncharacterized protein n=1 Tax=Henckelia pumila TaxID=405737 RepID=UPI003C6E27B7